MTAAREGERRGKTRQPSPEHNNIAPAPGHMPDHPRFPRKRQASRLSIPADELLVTCQVTSGPLSPETAERLVPFPVYLRGAGERSGERLPGLLR
jgi:hypothetical protein